MTFWQILGRFILSDTGETLQKVSETTIVWGQHPHKLVGNYLPRAKLKPILKSNRFITLLSSLILHGLVVVDHLSSMAPSQSAFFHEFLERPH